MKLPINDRFVVKTKKGSISWKDTTLKMQSYYDKLETERKTKKQELLEKERVIKEQERESRHSKVTVPDLLEKLDETLPDAEKKILKTDICGVLSKIANEHDIRYSDVLKHEILESECKIADSDLIGLSDRIRHWMIDMEDDVTAVENIQNELIKNFPNQYRDKIKK